MKFSIRREINFFNFEKDLSGLDGVPIELALPYILDDFLAGMDRIDDLATFVKNNSIIVNSVHAPQGRLTDERFMFWALPTVQFAEYIGACLVVFHPENATKLSKPNLQTIALQNVKVLQSRTPVTVAIETFGKAKNLITPEETIEKGLPMVLDTSHLFVERIFEVINSYAHGIAGVHLSEARGEGKETLQHLPVRTYGFAVLEKLKEKSWDGSITLEYLPEFHDQLIPDRDALQGLFG